eukprot:1523902-Pleurochrysis_carterae.AAC.1
MYSVGEPACHLSSPGASWPSPSYESMYCFSRSNFIGARCLDKAPASFDKARKPTTGSSHEQDN